MTIRVLINGALGRMGSLAVKAIEADPALSIVAKTDVKDDLKSALIDSKAQVALDLTRASVAFETATTIIEAGVSPVIGTSGLLPEQIKELQKRCSAKKIGGIIAPNFAISVLLIMRFAQEAAKHLPQAEIIELHHDGKEDAPSGSAIRTAELISSARLEKFSISPSKEVLPSARGASLGEVPIHSVRLQGLNAHEEILFGGVGQSLSLRSDVYNREAYMPGIVLACKKAPSLDSLLYGLENLL